MLACTPIPPCASITPAHLHTCLLFTVHVKCHTISRTGCYGSFRHRRTLPTAAPVVAITNDSSIGRSRSDNMRAGRGRRRDWRQRCVWFPGIRQTRPGSVRVTLSAPRFARTLVAVSHLFTMFRPRQSDLVCSFSACRSAPSHCWFLRACLHLLRAAPPSGLVPLFWHRLDGNAAAPPSPFYGAVVLGRKYGRDQRFGRYIRGASPGQQ